MLDPSGEENRPAAIGIDVGGTKVLGVALDLTSGEVIHQEQRPTPSDSEELVGAIGAVIERLGRHIPVVEGVGVGLPGLVDRDGVLRYGPNVPGIVDLDLGSRLARQGQRLAVDNDGANAARAELRFGAARGHRDVAVITQGTGVGSGLILGGQIYGGANGFAGEPGHMPLGVDADCACGRHGCWEAAASGTGLANLARHLLDEGGPVATASSLALVPPAALDGRAVADAIDAGDDLALTVLEHFVEWTARGVAAIVSLLDVELVILGGGVLGLSDRFLGEVTTRLQPMLMGHGFRPVVPVVAATTGPQAGAIGAALLGTGFCYKAHTAPVVRGARD